MSNINMQAVAALDELSDAELMRLSIILWE